MTWTSGLDDSGHPSGLPPPIPGREGTLVYPGVQGATNWWYLPSYSPHRLFTSPPGRTIPRSLISCLVTMWRGAGIPMARRDRRFRRSWSLRFIITGLKATELRAPLIRKPAFANEFKMADVTGSGVLTTVSDRFSLGVKLAILLAIDARRARSFGAQTQAVWPPSSGPTTYSVNEGNGFRLRG